MIWQIPVSQPEIYLTFDDGPVPDLTSFVLGVLEDFKAKATFFCVGDNIAKYPDICRKVVDSGHQIGNHTFNHLSGWATKNNDYFENIEKCQCQIAKYQDLKYKSFFRPPYGKITKSQINGLKHNYHIMMWDILAYDFNDTHKPYKGLKKMIEHTQPGSIVVFHDNYKAEKKLRYMLPRYLAHFREKGYTFKRLESQHFH